MDSKKDVKVQDVVEKIDPEKLKVDEEKQVKDIMGEPDDENWVMASSVHKKYRMYPVSLSKIPELTSIIKDIVDFMAKAGNKKDSSDAEMFGADDGKVIKMMCKMISLSLKGQLSPEQVGEEFSLGDFPKCFEKALDINDFFTGMRNIFQRKQMIG